MVFVLWALEKKCEFYCLVNCSINVNYILLVDGLFSSSISLMIFSLVILSTFERGIEITIYNCGFVYTTVLLIVALCVLLGAYIFRIAMSFLWNYPFIII